MTDLSSTTFCVFDHEGLFIPLARCLARSGAKVFYHTPQERRDSVFEAVMGDGMKPELDVVDNIWDVKSKVDTFVFPDVRHMGEQLELRAQGFPVWGAGRGMNLELDRQFFLRTLAELNLDVPPHEIVLGVTALRQYLADKEDIYIKVSKWRGSWETKHWKNQETSGYLLDAWAAKFGGIKDRITFLCFSKIETKLEIGCDTFNIDGRWPRLMLHGIEKKNKAYFSAVTPFNRMPSELTNIMAAFSPVLASAGYRCQWSMEARVTEREVYFIDATTRGGLPSTGSQILAMRNLPQVIHHGARGEVVEPEYDALFTAECMVTLSKDEDSDWLTDVFKPELKPHLMASLCCEVGGQLWWPPYDLRGENIGWLVAKGNTPTETAREMNRLADLLPDGCDAAVESLADIIREVEVEKEEGIPFTEMPMPEPEVVLEPENS